MINFTVYSADCVGNSGNKALIAFVRVGVH